MLRNLIALIAGVVLSWFLSIGGARLSWLLIVGNVDRSESKHAIIRWLLWNTFVVAPVVAVLVGAFLGAVVRRTWWWLGGIALVPLNIYDLSRDAHTPDLVMSVGCVALALGGAFVVSRFKRPQPA